MKGGPINRPGVNPHVPRYHFRLLLTAGAIYFFVLMQKQKHDTFGFDPNRPIPSDAVLKAR